MALTPEQIDMNKIVSLCKRRGFVFPSSDIYGGLGSTWDYGPLGVELKRNVKDQWWKSVVHRRDDMVGLDAAILMHPRTWEASGHAEGFTDPLVECKECHLRFREDHMEGIKNCPECGGEFTEARLFNLMLKTFLGPVEDSANQVWMRPETAQGIFVNFDNPFPIPFNLIKDSKLLKNIDLQEILNHLKQHTNPTSLKNHPESNIRGFKSTIIPNSNSENTSIIQDNIEWNEIRKLEPFLNVSELEFILARNLSRMNKKIYKDTLS